MKASVWIVVRALWQGVRWLFTADLFWVPKRILGKAPEAWRDDS